VEAINFPIPDVECRIVSVPNRCLPTKLAQIDLIETRRRKNPALDGLTTEDTPDLATPRRLTSCSSDSSGRLHG